MTQPQQIPESDAPPGEPQLAAAENTVAALVLAAFTAWLAAAAAAVLAGGIVNPASIWALQLMWEREIDGIMDDLARMARAGWERTASDLGVRLPFDPDSDVLKDQLRRTRNLLVRIPDEIYRQIIFELGQALDAGETPAQQADRIRNILDVNGSENWPSRARTIGITEVNRAYGYGGLAAAQVLAGRLDGQALMKRWESHDDSATRPAHRKADGQTVPIFQPFIVADEPLMMPSDPSGSPSNVINCRCRARFRKGL